MEKSKRISLLSFLVLLGFSFSILYHYIQGILLEKPYPANTFLFLPKYFLTDFRDVYVESMELNPYIGKHSAQFPFMVLLGKIFSFFPSYLSILIFYIIGIAILSYFAVKYLRFGSGYASATSIFIICFLSYPFLISVDRGNFEFLLFIFLLVFLSLFEREKYLWSTLPLAMAIGMKLYPAIFLFLFVSEKKWKEFFLTCGLVFALSITSLLLFKGGIYLNIMYLLQMSNFSDNHLFTEFTSILPGTKIQRGVSILSLIKIFQGINGSIPSKFWTDNFKIIYMMIATLIGVGVTLHVTLKQKYFWKKVAILVFLTLLLPPLSGDYKLIHIFLPLFFYVNTDQKSKWDYVYIFLFGLLLIPKDYYIFPQFVSDTYLDYKNPNDISISMPINIISMLIFTLVLLPNQNIRSLFAKMSERFPGHSLVYSTKILNRLQGFNLNALSKIKKSL